MDDSDAESSKDNSSIYFTPITSIDGSKQVFYKYMPFDEDTSLKAITEGTMKFTCPLEFNDPFDCNPNYDQASIDEFEINRSDLIKKAAKLKGLSPAKYLQHKKKLAAPIKQRMRSRDHHKVFMQEIGVCSLSLDPSNILMWSHYADNHRGFVIELYVPASHKKAKHDLAFNMTPLPVFYKEQRPVYKYGMSENTGDQITKLLLTKAKKWEYEQEWRVINQEIGAGIFPYNRDQLLLSVIAGIRMPDEDFKKLEAAVNDLKRSTLPNLRLFRAREHPTDYDVIIEGHPWHDKADNVTEAEEPVI